MIPQLRPVFHQQKSTSGFESGAIFSESWNPQGCQSLKCQGQHKCGFLYIFPLQIFHRRRGSRHIPVGNSTQPQGLRSCDKKALKCCRGTYVSLSRTGHVELARTNSGNERRSVLLPRGHGILGSTPVERPRDFHMRPLKTCNASFLRCSTQRFSIPALTDWGTLMDANPRTT